MSARKDKFEILMHDGNLTFDSDPHSPLNIILGTYGAGGVQLPFGYDELWLHVDLTAAPEIEQGAGGLFTINTLSNGTIIDTQVYNQAQYFLEKISLKGCKRLTFTGTYSHGDNTDSTQVLVFAIIG